MTKNNRLIHTHCCRNRSGKVARRDVVERDGNVGGAVIVGEGDLANGDVVERGHQDVRGDDVLVGDLVLDLGNAGLPVGTGEKFKRKSGNFETQLKAISFKASKSLARIHFIPPVYLATATPVSLLMAMIDSGSTLQTPPSRPTTRLSKSMMSPTPRSMAVVTPSPVMDTIQASRFVVLAKGASQ